MEQATIFNKNRNMYWETTHLNTTDLNNKLFCTFTSADGLEALTKDISQSYTIIYNKMFVLHVKSNNYASIISVEMFNMIGKSMLHHNVGNNATTINLIDLANGVYTLKVNTESGIFYQKISKQ